MRFILAVCAGQIVAFNFISHILSFKILLSDMVFFSQTSTKPFFSFFFGVLHSPSGRRHLASSCCLPRPSSASCQRCLTSPCSEKQLFGKFCSKEPFVVRIRSRPCQEEVLQHHVAGLPWRPESPTLYQVRGRAARSSTTTGTFS